jgi:hypothetical protein
MGRAALEAEASNVRRAMIYAISPEGFTHFIPDWFEELTMLNRAAADALALATLAMGCQEAKRVEVEIGPNTLAAQGTDAQADARQVGAIKQVLSFDDDAYTQLPPEWRW